MGIVTKTIILEDVLKNVFNYLPAMSYNEGGDEFSVTFGFGTKKDLNKFLTLRKRSTVYPLIWLLYPYNELHNQNNLTVENVVLILAVNGNNASETMERMKTTFGKILFPLLDNVKLAIKRANTLSFDEEFEVVKYPNYSETAEQTDTGLVDIWDALRVEFSLIVRDGCLRPITI